MSVSECVFMCKREERERERGSVKGKRVAVKFKTRKWGFFLKLGKISKRDNFTDEAKAREAK